jgi:tyrosine-protein kinase Etk/Wzc
MSNPEQLDKIKIIRFLFKYYKYLIIFPLISSIIAVGISFFIPKKYYSYGIVYPTAFNSVTKNLDNPTFGYDIDADRLIQIMESSQVKDSIIKKFDLIKYYEISKEDKDWHFQLMKKYKRDIKFERTNSMSVIISAKMKDPQLSADIVNEIIRVVDGARSNIIKPNIERAYLSLKDQYLRQKRIVDSLEKVIIDIRLETGINYPSLLPNSIIEFKPTVTKTNSSLELASIRYIAENDILYSVQKEMERARLQFEQPITGVYVTDYAIPNFHKASPSYSLNAILAFIISFVVTLIILILNIEIRSYKSLIK